MHNLVATRKKELDALGVGGERPDDGVFTRLVSELDEDAKHGLDKGEVVSFLSLSLWHYSGISAM